MQFAGPTSCGGVGTAFFSLAEALAARGHVVHVLLARDELDRLSSVDWERSLRRIGGSFVHLPRRLYRGSPFSGRREASMNCYRWLRRRHFDIIHFHDWMGLGYYSLLAKRRGFAFRSALMCVGAHGPEHWAMQGNGFPPSDIGHFETYMMERESVCLADVVISPSQYMLRWFEREGWSLPKRTYAHPNILWSEAISETCPNGSKVPTSEIVFFGRLEPRKGLYRFCDTLDHLSRSSHSGLRVTFLGRDLWLRDKGEWSSDFLHGRAAYWPFQVSVLADRNHEEALDYLRKPGRLAVMASSRDNSPYTVLECLGAGVRMICSDVGGVRELIHPDDRAQVLFNDEELTQKLLEVLDEGASSARPAFDFGWVRETWMRWHESVATSTLESVRYEPVVTQALR
ncbi:MAG: glycosyltransferase family 4 protein [Gemmatimonadales bacterium]